MKIVKLIVCILFALIMVNSGLNKFFQYMPMPELTEEQMKNFGALMQLKWLLPLVAMAEIVGGILFIFPKYRALAAIIILPITVGIVLHHVVLDPSSLAIQFMLLLINIWIIGDNWNKYKPMIN